MSDYDYAITGVTAVNMQELSLFFGGGGEEVGVGVGGGRGWVSHTPEQNNKPTYLC